MNRSSKFHRSKKASGSRPKRTSPKPPSTPSSTKDVEAVEGEEGSRKKPDYCWQMEAGLDLNFERVAKLLVSLNLSLYQHPEGGLLLVENGQARRITSAKEVAPLLIDHIRIAVVKNGKYQGEKPSDSVLTNMLGSRSFLDNFLKVEDVVTSPVVLTDHTPSVPGYNSRGRILYLGAAVRTCKGSTSINRFLDVMEWQTSADRTNAVAALLTVPFRHHWSGGKPFVLVTASKSHAGKGTLIEFIRASTAKAEISYEDKDWPMQRNLHDQLSQKPEIGVINFDNVRTDSSGRAKLIRTGFLESFITNSEIVLSSATARNKPLRMANRFVVLLNTNEGAVSIDLLNRSLPIRLNPTGDLPDRIARAKEQLGGGDVKHDWLPAHRDQIDKELWGMIDHWAKEGKPVDEQVRHPMGPWARTVGGILLANGYTDFLKNYSATRSAADPIREAISILAFFAGKEPKRTGVLAKIAVTQGLAKTLLPNVDSSNEAACQRAMGVTLSPYVGETFSARTATERITYRLRKQEGRFGEPHPHYRYLFEEIGREAISGDSPSGVVLEERSMANNFPLIEGLEAYQPEVL